MPVSNAVASHSKILWCLPLAYKLHLCPVTKQKLGAPFDIEEACISTQADIEIKHRAILLDLVPSAVFKRFIEFCFFQKTKAGSVNWPLSFYSRSLLLMNFRFSHIFAPYALLPTVLVGRLGIILLQLLPVFLVLARKTLMKSIIVTVTVSKFGFVISLSRYHTWWLGYLFRLLPLVMLVACRLCN